MAIQPEARHFTSPRNPFDIIAANSSRKADLLEKNPQVSEAVDYLLEAGVRIANRRQVTVDELVCNAYMNGNSVVITFDTRQPFD